MKKALTINHVATREKIKADGRTVAAWGRLRGFVSGTVQRIFAGSYPFIESEESEYQKVLRALEKDGYLVRLDESETEAA